MGGEKRRPPWSPSHFSICHIFLQLLGFFKGMSFPIASIAMVNSVLFGVYSNTLLALTATSHQERWAQPPSYIDVFIAGCTGGFVQVRGRCGVCPHGYGHAHAHRCVHAHTSTHARMWAQRRSVCCFPSQPSLQTLGLPNGYMRSCGGMPAPGFCPMNGLAELAVAVWAAGLEGRVMENTEGGGCGAEGRESWGWGLGRRC